MRKLFFALTVLALASCVDRDKFYDSIISTDPRPMTGPDEWIKSVYGKFNVDVIYKWDDYKTNQEYALVPIDTTKVKPCLDVIRRIWMEPYLSVFADAAEGELFLKKTCPKQLVLLGSAVYMEDGNRIIGETAQGNSITLYNLNHQNPKDDGIVDTYALTFHHEFIHILHQNVKYPSNFETLSGGNYTTGWAGYTVDEALALGFIDPYAMESPNEDFAQLVSKFITLDAATWQTQFNAAQAQSATGYSILRQKESIAKAYMKGTWGVELDDLRALVQNAVGQIKSENAAGL